MIEQTLAGVDILFLAACAFLVGLYILVKGGNYTIDAAVYIAKEFKISPLIIGFTVIAFGTSLPELVVSVAANMQGFPGLSIGNVIGSNVTNILLCVGLSAFLVTLASKAKTMRRDVILLMAASFILAGCLQLDVITRAMGGGMFAILVGFVIWQYRQARKEDTKHEDHETEVAFGSLGHAIFLLLLGLAMVGGGAEILVRGAVIGATTLQISEAVIGMTIIAVGTSLPEIVTCVIAARKKQADIIIGNIMGSNVFNILSIVGLTALLQPINVEAIDARLPGVDVWLMVGLTAVFCGLVLWAKKIGRPVAVTFLALYALFVADQYFGFLS